MLDANPSIKVYIGENVDELLKVQSDNARAAREMFATHGWATRFFEMKSAEYGNPSSRGRAWSIGIHVSRSGRSEEECHSILADIVSQIEAFKVPPLAMDDVLLADDDPYVMSERQIASESVPPQDTMWQGRLSELLASMKMTWRECQPPHGHAGSPGFEAITDRERMNLAVTVLSDPSVSVVDVSQQIGRTPARSDGLFSSFTQRATPYVLSRRRAIIGKECLMVHGFPHELLPQTPDGSPVSDALLRDLAGRFEQHGCARPPHPWSCERKRVFTKAIGLPPQPSRETRAIVLRR